MADETKADSAHMQGKTDLSAFFHYFFRILGPEKDFYWLAVVYGVGISLLSLAIPVSVQMLINTVANIGLPTPLAILSLTLFAVLLVSGLLNALRIHLMEIFGRRFYARLVAEISLKSMYARNPFFTDAGKADLFNRYFDIVTVQKTVPYLLIGGFTILLQAAVGFVLVSLYHWYFLVFNAVFFSLILLIWAVWGRRAINSGIELSHRKYATAKWLEGLGAANGFYKSQRHIAHALNRTEAFTASYIDQHRRHFRRHFSQTLGFLVIYAMASAALLGLGGWLVIQRELSIGQLVAAELILSSVFFGVSQLGSYLNSFYDLCGAVDELSLFWKEPVEEPSGRYQPRPGPADLKFDAVRGEARGGSVRFDFTIPAGAQVMACSSSHGVQRLFVSLLKRHERPQGGVIALDGADILDMEVHALRQDVMVLDRPSTVEMSIRAYLNLAADFVDPAEKLEVLRIVGLDTVMGELDDGLDTVLATTGWPLSVSETLQLKLAAALLARPRVLVLTQLYDVVPEAVLRRALDWLAARRTTSVVYFSNRSDPIGFTRFLFLGAETQELFESPAAYAARFAERYRVEPPPAGGPPSLRPITGRSA